MHPSRRQNRVLATLTLASLMLLTACRADILIRLATRVYADGGMDRTLEVRGRTSDNEQPTEVDWMAAKAGIRLAERDRWARVEESPGFLRAEGFFVSAASLPPLLSFATEHGSRNEAVKTRLTIEDRVILRRWIYREQHSDPYSAAEIRAALDSLVELLVDAVEQELRREFGDGFDTQGAVAFLRGEGRGFASAILSVKRRNVTYESYAKRTALLQQVLSQYGMQTARYDPDEFDFWEAQFPIVLTWLRQRIASSLSTPDQSISAEELGFIPVDENELDQLDSVIARIWGDEEALFDLVGPSIAALSGYYAADNSPNFSFHSRVQLPGMLLKTNGTPDDNGIVWTFRAEGLSSREIVLRAESVGLIPAALVQLGARREFDAVARLQLVSLLWTRDPDGVVHDLLQRAHEQGSLDILRETDSIPDTYVDRVRELLDLLDPEVELPQPLS